MIKINIIFLSIGRLSNINDNGLYTDLLRKFRDEGHNLYVVTPLKGTSNEKFIYSKEEDVHFLRVNVGDLKGRNMLEKGITTISIDYIFKKVVSKYFKNILVDLVLYTTPPITLEKTVNYIKKRDNARTYLLLKDIFPQNAIDLNLLSKKNPIYHYFKHKERKLYLASDYIGCMSPRNVEYLLENNSYLNKNNIEVSPNSINPRPKSYFLDKSSILDKYSLPRNKIIMLYGGNLGKPQGINYLLECMDSNINNNRVHFVIAGSGTQIDKLKKFIKDKEPNNITLLNTLPKKEYDELIAACDVGLIFLDYRFTIPNFPSRILPYMEASKPVLAATDKNTDIGKIIEENNFGKSCISENPNDFTKLLPYIYNKKARTEMGKNARRYLEENYTVDKSYAIIMKHFEKKGGK